MAAKLADVLNARATVAALVARVGSDLWQRRFEGREVPRFTHVGVALRLDGAWRIHHLLNTGEGPWGHLYCHGLADFFRDDPFEYRAGILVPSLALQRRLAATVESPLGARLYEARYSAVAHPFATRYQGSNQWVLELVAAAQSGGVTRAAVQDFHRRRGFEPDVLCTAGLAGQLVATWLRPNTRFDDHPLADRRRGRVALVLERALRRYVQRTDAVLSSVEIGLGVPVGDPCPAGRLPGSGSSASAPTGVDSSQPPRT